MYSTCVVWGPDLFSGGKKEGRKGLETLAAFPCALGIASRPGRSF